MTVESYEQGIVSVQGETVSYDMRIVDARPARQRMLDERRGCPANNIMVVVPGHGQSIHGPKKLVDAAAQLSRSKIVWCIDPVPAKGGDRAEAGAIAQIVGDRISAVYPRGDSSTVATLIGWSHGGGEALLAAEHEPDLFPQYLGLCPTGLIDRSRPELLYSFFLEATRILWTSARRGEWTCMKDALRLGWNAGVGLLRDLWRSRSPRRVTEDIGWAARNIASSPLGYPGEVVILFGAQDTVVRWQDIFLAGGQPQNIEDAVRVYQEKRFPDASRFEVQIIEGAHVAPEANPPAFLRVGLGLLGQLDGSRLDKNEGECV